MQYLPGLKSTQHSYNAEQPRTHVTEQLSKVRFANGPVSAKSCAAGLSMLVLILVSPVCDWQHRRFTYCNAEDAPQLFHS